MARYKLNVRADDDLDRIFDYGIDHHGFEDACAYMEGLKQRFKEIGRSPLQYPTVNDIREGYRRSVYRAHAIYYRIGQDMVEIMRILGQQDPTKHL